MKAGAVIGFVIYLAVALIMIGLGISQLKAKKPVGFYTGEEPPREDELSDVKAWNKKHGTMWVVYGVVLIASYGIGALLGDTLWSLIPVLGGVLVPLPIMIWYHHRLTRIYRR